jgi:hypothetical protein
LGIKNDSENCHPGTYAIPKWLPCALAQYFILGNRPEAYKIHAIVTTYIRLVEGAYVHYRSARQHVQEFWNNHTSIGVGSANLSATYFEDCINSMYRAVLCMKRIRSYPEVPNDLKSLFPNRPQFAKNAVADRLRSIHDAIQHMDERVLKEIIPKETPFALMATGPEAPIPDQPNQTLKVIDRLTIGSDEILFADLVTWLHEMGECAEVISKYQRPK